MSASLTSIWAGSGSHSHAKVTCSRRSTSPLTWWPMIPPHPIIPSRTRLGGLFAATWTPVIVDAAAVTVAVFWRNVRRVVVSCVMARLLAEVWKGIGIPYLCSAGTASQCHQAVVVIDSLCGSMTIVRLLPLKVFPDQHPVTIRGHYHHVWNESKEKSRVFYLGSL